MRKFYVFAFLVFTFHFSAWAGECVVSNASELIKKIEAVAEAGACETGDPSYRNTYEKYRGTSIVFHVIKFDSSTELDESLPCLSGYEGNPLIIVVPEGEKVILNGSSPVCISGKGGPVFIDNLTVKSGGIKISSNGNAVINSHISNGKVELTGSSNIIDHAKISDSPGNGLELLGDKNKILDSEIGGSSKYGVYIRGRENAMTGGEIYKNKNGGLYVKTCEDEDCTEPVTALASKTVFSKNDGGDVLAEKWPMPSPQDLVSIATSTEWKVTGDLSDNPEYGPWKLVNIKAVKVELFIKDGPFVAETDEIDATTRNFVFSLPRPLVIDGKEYPNPAFTAFAVDYENKNTSSLSTPLDTTSETDWDGDGLPNEQEDYNLNGAVDFGETDPRNKDTDGDGLTDGEERLHNGRVAALIEKGSLFADLSKLDPVNPDSDGDCLGDGMELGLKVAVAPANAAAAIQALVTTGKTDETTVSPYCKAILKKHNVMEIGSADADPLAITDPTSSDTDNDGLNDGEEDWNFNGKRDFLENLVNEPLATSHKSLFLETDPNLPDSDGDTLLDGAEGDKNSDDKLNENETDPLLKDTDGDGVTDDVEIRRYGSLPNECDTDKDGLSDGIEAGVINPDPENPECAGLQTAGTNFAAIEELSPVKTDSDGDGIADGAEDENHNGWLDPSETDPTTSDTDGDGISDEIEALLDINRDGITDIDIGVLNNGDKCAPPANVNDIDCDMIVNTRDADSDNDGCTDQDEGIETDKDKNGIPDVWEQGQASCGGESGGGGTSGGSSPIAPSGETGISPSATASANHAAEPFSYGGGDCSLVTGRDNTTSFGQIVMLLILVVLPVAFGLSLRGARQKFLAGDVAIP